MFDRHTYVFDSPVGTLEVAGDKESIFSLSFIDSKVTSPSEHPPKNLLNCKKQIEEYFEGKRKVFNLNLKPEGTFFQTSVWTKLLEIPYGKTISYLELSRRINNERAIRAVGAANGKNPIAIIIPCHRVIGSNQQLTGYGGGLWRKQILLELEEKYACGILRLF